MPLSRGLDSRLRHLQRDRWFRLIMLDRGGRTYVKDKKSSGYR